MSLFLTWINMKIPEQWTNHAYTKKCQATLDCSCPLKAQILCDKASHYWPIKNPLKKEQIQFSKIQFKILIKTINWQETIQININFWVLPFLNSDMLKIKQLSFLTAQVKLYPKDQTAPKSPDTIPRVLSPSSYPCSLQEEKVMSICFPSIMHVRKLHVCGNCINIGAQHM